MKNNIALVQKAKSGDTEAFASLYGEVYEDLYRFALYTLKNPVDAQDVVSDAVMDAFAAIGKLRVNDAFKSWIFRILSNKCKKKLKEYVSRPKQLEEGRAEWEIHFAKEGVEEEAQIRMLFMELPQEDRMIIAMHLFGGFTGKEIARQLHMNENTVRSRESRALKKMRDQWEQ